jgi:N-acetylmuramoyl-L-alanine amidase
MQIISRPSPNFNERKLPITHIVLHYTDTMGLNDTLAILTSPDRPASAHYVVDYDGAVYQLVDDTKRAWHAGNGCWQGIDDMNSASIGIEIENPGHGNGYAPFTEAQIVAVIDLCSALVRKHGINPRNVIGHSDYAPQRKEDPGHLFPWRRLALSGFGRWPEPKAGNIEPMTDAAACGFLAHIGYDIADSGAALLAFQRHFCPQEMGQGLGPDTRAVLLALSANE